MKQILGGLALLLMSGDLLAAGIRNGCIPGTSGCGNCSQIVNAPGCPPPDPSGSTFSDFDRDGKNDLLFHHYSAGLQAWVKYDKPSAGWLPFVPAGMNDSAWSAVAVGYFGPATGTPLRDQDTDVLWQHDNTGALRIWQMNRNQRISNLTVTCPTGLNPCTNPAPPWKAVATGFFATPSGIGRDGKSDILFWNSTTGALRVWVMDGPLVAKEIALTSSMPLSWVVLGTGFFDEEVYDPYSDIAWFNPSTGEVQVWIMTGTTVDHQELVGFETNLDWNAKGVVDLKQDGYPDILFRKAGVGNMRSWCLFGTVLSTVEPLSMPNVMTPWKPVN